MSDWRYIAQRLNGDGTGTLLDTDLPLSDVTITKVFSGPASIQATVTPAVRRLLASDGDPILEEWSTAVYADNGGSELVGGIVDSMTKAGPAFGFGARGFSGYLAGMPYDGSIFFVEKDPLDIACHIWDHVQGKPKGNLGLRIDRKTKTGKQIGQELKQVEFDTQAGPVSFEAGPYKLNWWETLDLGKNLDDLANDTPFDYREWHRWNSTRTDIEHYLDWYYPRIGRRRDDLRFVLGENIIPVPTENFDGQDYASEVWVNGAGEGRTMFRGLALRQGEKRLRRPQVVEDKSLKSIRAVQARAQRELALRLGRGDIASVVVSDHKHARIGSWMEGDEVRVQGDGPWGDFDLWCQVLSTTITPADPTNVTVNLLRADKIGT